MPISRTKLTALVDDDGSGTVGTQWNKAHVTDVYDDIDAQFAATQNATLAAGNNNNLALNADATILATGANAAGSTLTGVTGGVPGRLLFIVNSGSGFTTTITAEDANSTAANRFQPGVTLAGGENAMFVYTNRWRYLK